MKKLLEKFRKNSFTLSVGDDGAILCLFYAGNLVKRAFASSHESANENGFEDLLNQFPKAPVKILLDVSEQFYSKKELPGVNSFSINGLVKNRLKRDYDKNDITTSIFLNQSKTGRRNWNYIFVNTPFDGVFKNWIEWLVNFDNPYDGAYLLPIESFGLLQLLEKKVADRKPKKQAKEKKWQILLSHDRIGGFRQTVFYDGKAFFSRMVVVDNDETPSFLAGAVEQELFTTTEYLKNQGINADEKIEIFTVVSSDIKMNLSEDLEFAHKFHSFTPFQISEEYFPGASQEKDSYADVIIATSFINGSSKNRLKIRQLQKLQLLEFINGKAAWLLILFLPIILINISLNQFNIMQNTQKSKILQQDYQQLKQRFDLKEKNEMDFEEASRITDIISLYKLLKINDISPIEVISQFISVKPENAFVDRFLWEIPNDSGSRNFKKNFSKTSLDIKFHNKSGGYQQLFNEFDKFINAMEKSFAEYDVEYSRINDKINFSSVQQSIPVKINIIGPKKAKR